MRIYFTVKQLRHFKNGKTQIELRPIANDKKQVPYQDTTSCFSGYFLKPGQMNSRFVKFFDVETGGLPGKNRISCKVSIFPTAGEKGHGQATEQTTETMDPKCQNCSRQAPRNSTRKGKSTGFSIGEFPRTAGDAVGTESTDFPGSASGGDCVPRQIDGSDSGRGGWDRRIQPRIRSEN